MAMALMATMDSRRKSMIMMMGDGPPLPIEIETTATVATAVMAEREPA